MVRSTLLPCIGLAILVIASSAHATTVASGSTCHVTLFQDQESGRVTWTKTDGQCSDSVQCCISPSTQKMTNRRLVPG
ncbi:hypothetical protein BCV70DRAFT_200303 [Testicularia cyperi]|uniref:Uncharacterized protein n=1 Tax=Testicularia cyperi TaxID=1882483 RepID=A0A317XQI2_9BASI|nr:hypothetical protein BCV70DRAFT_200303 [Testicularia cyperi]